VPLNTVKNKDKALSNGFVPKIVTAEKLKISVCGLGYVGIVTTGCLSDLGHKVIGVDNDPRKLEMVGRGESPISEPMLSELLAAGVKNEKVSVSPSLMGAVWDTDVTFVSVKEAVAI